MINWVQVNGVVLRYDLSGQDHKTATPIVLVHEMGGTLETWDGVAPALAKDRTVLRFDVRGNGFSEKIRGTLDIDECADDIAALLDRLDMKQKVAIAGDAVGAAISIHFAARYPERVAALVAMAPATFLPEDRKARARANADKLDKEGARAMYDPAQHPSGKGPVDDYTEVLLCRRLANDPHGVAGMWRMLAALSMDDDFAKIACPTLILAGTLDKARPPALVEESVAKKMPGARFRILETGHVMPVETPALIVDTLRGFLADTAL